MGKPTLQTDPSMGNIVGFFGAQHVQRLTGLSAYQLREWDKAGFFAPEYAYENRRVAAGRVYSFRDLVGLRTLAVLSKKYRIRLPELKRTANRLKRWSETPWSSLTLYVLNREVHFKNPTTGEIQGAVSGQLAAAIPLENVMQDMRAGAESLSKRGRKDIGKFDRHRFRMRNEWCFKGTRIPVAVIFRYLDAGFNADKILREYPSLSKADIREAIEHRDELDKKAA